MSKIPLRVSCAGLVKIEIQGKLLGIINKKRLAAGVTIYTPPGGSYHYQGRATRHYLQDALVLTFEEGRDLRFSLPGDPDQRLQILDSFNSWFKSGQGRETVPSRELYEELIGEEGVLSLEQNSFPKLSHLSEKQKHVRLREASSRPGHIGVITEYFFELFQAHLTKHSRKALLQGLKQRYPMVRLLALDEILMEKTKDSLQIKDHEGPVPIASSFFYFL